MAASEDKNQSGAPRRQHDDDVLGVVGIGASAGGIEAILPLMRNLPTDTNMGFVVIMHLDPGHASQLGEILARSTSMPVAEAVEGMKIEANHVYVIPPNALLQTDGGTLRLSPRADRRLPSLPIDHFFFSLAEDFTNRAVGVVLSGTGSDGAAGLKAIKAATGITIAQDESAQHGGMPRSAIQTDCVDFILPPAEIANELTRVSRHPYLRGSESSPFSSTEKREILFGQLFQLLRNATQIDYANYKRSTIERRIQRRMLKHRTETLTDYLHLIRGNPEEILELHQELLIHVTRFFREPEAFAVLKTVVFPALCGERPTDTPIRVWVPGCSTGEEVYSLAISLLEFQSENSTGCPIKFFATDVSEESLAYARAGIYPESITTDVSAERLRRYFVREGATCQISKSIRDLCVFARHDVTRDPPFSNLDLISCRNVLIYLGPVLQKRVLSLFHYALKPGRFLFLGGSETVGNLSDLYEYTNAAHRIYATKLTGSRMSFDFSSGGTTFTELTDAPATVLVRQDTRGFLDLKSEADRAVLTRYAPPGVVVDENYEILQFRGHTGAFLTPAPGNASLKLLKMAREGLLVDLRATLDEARSTKKPTRSEGVLVRAGDSDILINLQVIPLQFAAQPCFAVLFEEPQLSDSSTDEGTVVSRPESGGVMEVAEHKRQLAQHRQELELTKEYLQSTIEEMESSNEELKAANEEIVSSNEELQSTNEELQTAKEELQASNEELNTVNEELQHRNVDTTRLNDDLTNLLRCVHIPIVMVGPDLRVRRYTPAAAELFNLILTDVGRPLADVKSKLVDVPLEHWMAQVLETLNVVEHEVRDQSECWYRMSLRPYRTQENRIEGVVLSVIDIDTVKKSEQHLKAARDYAESILGAIHVPIVVLDLNLKLQAVNSAFCEFFKVTSSETEQRFLTDLGNRQWDIPALTQLLSRTLTDGINLRDYVVRHEFPTIGNKIMLLNARPISFGGGTPGMILLSIEDITEHQRAMSVLRDSQVRENQKMESLGRLAGGIAHDFNNLLTIVNGYSGMLLDRHSADSQSAEMLRAISDAGMRAASLTQQLLAYGRTQILQPRVIDLNVLLSEMQTLLTRLLGEDITIEKRLSSEPAWVKIDPSRMEQVIMNLCINARDAMPDGGSIVLETGHIQIDEVAMSPGLDLREGCYLQLIVRDDGCGIDPLTLTRIFDPFFTTKEIGKGTGLGLATVYGIIKQSRGHIVAESQVNLGTTFRIYLPVAETESTAAASEPLVTTSGPEFPAGTKTVVVVEDEDSIRTMVVMLLRDEGFQTIPAANGEEALQLCRTFPGKIDLVITDVLMPGMNGQQLGSLLRSQRPETPVLFMSGHSDEMVRRQGVAIDSDAFLQKPFEPAEFCRRVHQMLDLHK